MLALWHRFGTMKQVFSLMETHLDDRTQFRMKKERYTQGPHWPSRVYTQVHSPKGAYSIHTHFHGRKGTYMLENLVLVCGIWSMVFWSLVLVQGILSEVLTLGIGSKVLILSGFGPWYWVRHKTIKRGEDH